MLVIVNIVKCVIVIVEQSVQIDFEVFVDVTLIVLAFVYDSQLFVVMLESVYLSQLVERPVVV